MFLVGGAEHQTAQPMRFRAICRRCKSAVTMTGSLLSEIRIRGEPPRLSRPSSLLWPMGIDRITVRGARQHNLKNINVEIPRDKFTVITGLSGDDGEFIARYLYVDVFEVVLPRAFYCDAINSHWPKQ